MTIQMEAIEQYFQVVRFIILDKGILTFKSADETLVCDHSNESYFAVLHVVLFIMPYKRVQTLKSMA